MKTFIPLTVHMDCGEKVTPLLWYYMGIEKETIMASNRTKYSEEMREQTAAFILESGRSATSVAEEMGIDVNMGKRLSKKT